MFGNFRKITIISALVAALFLLGAQPGLWAGAAAKGSLTGYVYQSDGTSPARGAVVKLRNLATGDMRQSTPSSDLGFFKVDSLERGLYIFGAITERGEFNGRDIIGIEKDSTAKLSISLDVQAETQAASGSANEPPAIRGEKFLGRVVKFDTSTLDAQIFVEKGELRLGDNIHLKGDEEKGSETNFYQKTRNLIQNGQPMQKAEEGQYYNIILEKPVLENDWIYIKEKSGLGVLFLTPIGMATVLAGSTGIVYIIITDPTPTSIYRH